MHRLQNTIKPVKHGKRIDHVSVFAALVIIAQQLIGNRPDKVGDFFEILWHVFRELVISAMVN